MLAALALGVGLGLAPLSLYVAGPLLEHYWLEAIPKGRGRAGRVVAPILVAAFYQWSPYMALYVLASTLIRSLAGKRLAARITLSDHYVRIVYGWLVVGH